MSFAFPQKVLFRHCDPAGIVFYPRYFEMINDCVEAFFDEVLAFRFEDLHRHGGIPTVDIRTTFKTPGRHGDRLELNLTCTKVGRSSLNLQIIATCGESVRFVAEPTLVFIDLTGRPAPWPEDLKSRLTKQLEGP